MPGVQFEVQIEAGRQRSTDNREVPSIQFQRALIFDVLGADRTQLVPEKQNARNHNADTDADGQKPAIGGESDQQRHDDRNSDDQAG